MSQSHEVKIKRGPFRVSYSVYSNGGDGPLFTEDIQIEYLLGMGLKESVEDETIARQLFEHWCDQRRNWVFNDRPRLYKRTEVEIARF